MLFDDTLDELHGALDAVAGGVDAKVVVDGVSPLAAGIELVVMAVLAVQLFQQLAGALVVQVVGLHHVAGPGIEGGVDEDGDVGDAEVGEDHIGAAAHDDEVLLLGHIRQEVRLVEEDGVLLGETMIAVEVFEVLLQASVVPAQALVEVLVVGEAGAVMDGVLLRFQPLQNLGEDLGVVVVDVELVGQGEANVRTGAAVGAADADDEVIVLAEALAKIGAVQGG